MPRLLILCEYPTLLGGERSMLVTMPAVASSGFEPVIAAPPNGALADELYRRGIEHVPWNTHDDRGVRFPLELLRSGLATLIRAAAPSLIHANSLSTTRISGPVAAHAGRRSIGHLRDIVKFSLQAVADINTHRRLIAVSQSTRDFHVAQGLSAVKCAVVHNGVDLAEFAPRPKTRYLHQELNLPAKARLVAVIGQLGLRKGTDIALEAALDVAPDFPQLHWLIVGERTSSKEESQEFEATLHTTAAEPCLAGRVHFLGTRTDVPGLLAECDLLVHAARQEPLGRVLLEAAATALPIIATDVGGTREIFPVASQAVLVPTDNIEALAKAIRELLLDHRRQKELGTAARRRAEIGFGIRNAAPRLVEQYEYALA
jgi:glycosyltransferase involved in cell wall biosynthesis